MHSEMVSKSRLYATTISNIIVPIMQEYEKATYGTNNLTKRQEQLNMYLTEFLDASIEQGQAVFSSSDNLDYEEQWHGFKILSNNFLKGKAILPDDLLLEISILEPNKIEVFKLKGESEDHLAEVYFNDYGDANQVYYINQNTFDRQKESIETIGHYLLADLLIGELSNDRDMVM